MSLDQITFRTQVLLVIASGWVFIGGVIGVGGLVLAVPEWRAAHGDGRTGTFTLTESLSCDRWPPPRHRCGWFGDFVSDDGTVVRKRMELAGGLPEGATVGDTVPARDTGSPAQIYPLTDRQGWKASAGFAAGGFGACLIGLLILEPWSWFRKARPRSPDPHAPDRRRGPAPPALTAVTTIEQLERDVWPDPGPDATSLVRRCAELRRKPIVEFTVEDLRIMLGQEIGVPALLPRAVEVLLRDPLAEGTYYPGDLLTNVLRLRDAAWSSLQTERKRLASVLTDLVAKPPFSDPDLKPCYPDRLLRDAIVRFLGR